MASDRLGEDAAAIPDDRDPPADRLATAAGRKSPDFVIIGAQRAGTTSLYRYLSDHPDVSPAYRKEINFFDRYYARGWPWYLAHFAEQSDRRLTGEATPNYLVSPAAPDRMRRHLPETKLIVLLRNPIDRAYSNYQMPSRRLRPAMFEAAIDEELDQSGGEPQFGAKRGRITLLARGRYYDQLEHWLKFFPQEQMLILPSERFFCPTRRNGQSRTVVSWRTAIRSRYLEGLQCRHLFRHAAKNAPLPDRVFRSPQPAVVRPAG